MAGNIDHYTTDGGERRLFNRIGATGARREVLVTCSRRMVLLGRGGIYAFLQVTGVTWFLNGQYIKVSEA